MGVWSDILGGVRPEPYRTSQPRPLTVEDRTGWADEQDKRGHRVSRTPQNLGEVRKLIKHRNPLRWMQLQRDFKWVQKEMKRLGLNPEDARYIL